MGAMNSRKPIWIYTLPLFVANMFYTQIAGKNNKLFSFIAHSRMDVFLSTIFLGS